MLDDKEEEGEVLRWNVAAECISVVFLVIIWSYARKGDLIPSLKNRLFQCCFLATFCAMVSNILSTAALAFPQYVPYQFSWAVTIIYFISTPLMGMAYFFYTTATVYENHKGISKVIGWSSIPGILYLLLAIANLPCKLLFNIMPDGTYTQGPLIITTYLVFYIYSLAAMVIVLIKHSWIEKKIRRILAIFPFIAMIVIVIQQLFPNILLSGSAATSALLLIYLYLQNKQISFDYLTDIPNRQEFLKMLELMIRKNEKTSFTIIVLSLRGFKQINDTFGQQSGDAFLKAVSAYLHTIIEKQYLFRFSGDEFAILEKNTEKEKIYHIIDTLKERMTIPWTVKEYSCIIQSAMGIVSYPQTADSVEGLINGIEYAVSKAKQDRTKAVCYCGQEMMRELRRRIQIAEILKAKLENNDFDVYYQPIVDTRTNKFVLAESLLRIPSSPIGAVYPDEFIPIAEETGMIIEMTYQILAKVCRYINRLLEQGIELDGIHVNFSTVQFTQIDLAEKVLNIIEEHHTPYSKIKIEITESVLAESAQLVIGFAEEMHKHGVMMGLDDFGTGYSNIVSVMETPLDVIKIDKSLVWSSMTVPKSAGMLRSMTGIFHDMDLKVLAEGVETPEQDQFIKESGIDYIQGFLYARPMPGDDMLKLLQADK
ncbi:EAL domain-containing protein [Robinsoniella sp. KNHs210]|uniref:EAL domain-containing protein n=1 Tax=Robinsoniella sp. KNHs210 TaxID=1469950 RepID=UPI000A756B01|nr:EAL domain-containing protein [Robinsoniella sp. KNHs210]